MNSNIGSVRKRLPIPIRILLCCCVILTVLVLAIVAQYQQNRRLFAAVRDNDAETVENLLAVGADPNARDYNDSGFQPFYAIVAKMDGRTNPSYAPTPLIAATESQASGRYKYDVLPENVALVRALLDHGARWRDTDHNGANVLELSVGSGKDQTVELILDREGAGTTARELNSALVYAVRLAQPRIVEMLLRRGADPNTEDSYGRKMYAVALQMGRPDLAQILENHGAIVRPKAR